MTFLLEVALRSSAPVVVGLLACVLLRRRSAALRHRVLAAALIAAAAVVPLSVILPSWGVPFPMASVERLDPPAAAVASEAGVTAVVPATARTAAPLDPMEIVFFGWIAGVAIGTGVLLLGIARLLRLTIGAEAVVDGHWRRLTIEIAARYGVGRPIALLTTRASGVLATWGFRKPRVLLPAQARTWSEDQAHVALCHELAHISRYDWPVQIAAEVLRTIFWFNPLFWLACARLRREAEHACDDAVLDAGIPATAYAAHLVDIARACRRPAAGWLPALSMARPSTLEGRITAMLNTRLNRQVPTGRAMAVILVALIGIVLPSASFDLSAQALGPGALTGSVYDNTGGVLPSVEVTLHDGQQAQRSAVTDGTGAFRFPGVGAGTYVLEATLPGFRTLRNEFVMETPRDWTRTITMQVGELEETIRVTAKRPAQVVALAQTPGRTDPVRVGGSIRQPRKLKDVAPVYPSTMRDAGLEGVVPMDAVIAPDGRVASVWMLSAEVHPAFARAAEDAVRQWVFTPTLLNGKPVEVQFTVSVTFSLED